MGLYNSKNDDSLPSSPPTPKRHRATKTRSRSSSEAHPLSQPITLKEPGVRDDTKFHVVKTHSTISLEIQKPPMRSNTSPDPLVPPSRKLSALSKLLKPKPQKEAQTFQDHNYIPTLFKQWLGVENPSLFLKQQDVQSATVIQESIRNCDINTLYAALQYGMMPSKPERTKNSEVTQLIKAFQTMHTLGSIAKISEALPKLNSKKEFKALGIKIHKQDIEPVCGIINKQFTEMTGLIFLLSLEISQYQKNSPFKFSAYDATQWLYVDSSDNKDSFFNYLSNSQRVSYAKISKLQEAVETYTSDKGCFDNFVQIATKHNQSLSK